jgi:hypothetical protein
MLELKARFKIYLKIKIKFKPFALEGVLNPYSN